MTDVECFWIKPTSKVQLYLRRFVSQNKPCLRGGYHDKKTAYLVVEEGKVPEIQNAGLPHNNHLWPGQCVCGYGFRPEDPRQLFSDTIYEHKETGERFPLREAPPGAMWDATWMEGHHVGPDGIHLVVKLPNGSEWMPDQPSANGNRPWVRGGTIPKVTCSPSIAMNGYHGWLRDGVLTQA